MIRFSRDIIHKSVFRRIPKNTPMNDILAVLFHRLAATTYLLYALWAVFAIIDGIPSITRAQGDIFTFWFATAILVVTLPACLGATFWPRLARLELFAGGSFTGLLVFYYFVLFRGVIEQHTSIAGFVILLSVVILPLCRTIVVVLLLIRQAKREQEARY